MAYSTISKPTDYFNTKLYTGTGSSNAITGIGFQPDFVWIKKRNGTTQHALFDALRGTGKYLESSSTAPDQTDNNSLSAFGTDGFTVISKNSVNTNGDTYVSWNWKGANSSGTSNSDGSITSTVSANTTAGFSIVKYTGTGSNATVGHGLGASPKMIIFKDTTNNNTNWAIYHKSIGNDYRLTLNDNTARQGTNANYYQSTDPTSSVFYVGSNTRANASGAVTIAYCFAEKTGYSKFGSYTGNGNADGAFVYTGFKPAWVLVKKTSEAREWMIWDNKRDSFNVSKAVLHPDNTAAEDSSTSYEMIDILSNGFKLRQSDTDTNQSGGTYIFMAFAENPFVNSNGVPTNAR